MNNFNRDFKAVDTSHEVTAEQKILESIAFILCVVMSVAIFALAAVK